jgi:hypothetical protein
MDEETYESGPDVSVYFPVTPQPSSPLPFDFDPNCSKCGKLLDRIYARYNTRRQPFAVFACTGCPHRLYLFEAPRIPLILTQEEFPRSTSENGETKTSLESACFSEYIDLLIEKREDKYRRNQIRAENARMDKL